MKKLTWSLIAISMINSGAFADIKFNKISADAKLFYATSDKEDYDFFDKEGAIGDSALNIKGSAKVGKYSSGIINYGITGVSTLGLENSLVSGTWVEHDKDLSDAIWIDTLNLVTKPFVDTTFIIGR